MKKTIHLISFILAVLLFTNTAKAQGVAVNTTGSPADTSAIMDVSSTTQGILVPRMLSAQRMAISGPANGLLVYQTDDAAGFYFYNAGTWQSLSTPANATTQGNTFNNANQLVQLNGSAQLPAVDGSQLTNLPSSAAAAGTLTGGTLASGVTSSSLTSVGTLTGLTVSTPINGSVTGNAGTATKLATPRNINGVAFDGTADITAPAAAGTLTGGTLASGVTTSSLTSVGTLTNLTVTNPISGAVTGNAGTATKLATARNINGVAFDGSADITAPAAAGTLTGGTLASGVTSSSLTSVGTLANLTVTNPINGSVTGNAGTATKLATARTINGTSFDGSANVTVTAAAGTLTGTILPALNGAALTSLTAGNINGVIPAANLGTSSGTATTFLNGAGAFTTPVSGGAVFILSATSTGQTITVGGTGVAPTTVQFATASTIPTGYGTFTSNVFKATVAGVYIVTVSLAPTGPAVAYPIILQNTTIVAVGSGSESISLPSPSGRSSTTAIVNMAVNDTITVKVSNASSSSGFTLSSDGTTRLTIAKL